MKSIASLIGQASDAMMMATPVAVAEALGPPNPLDVDVPRVSGRCWFQARPKALWAAIFQQPVHARTVDTEGLSDGCSAHATRLHLAHLRHVYRGRAALVDAFGLRLGDAFQLALAT